MEINFFPYYFHTKFCKWSDIEKDLVRGQNLSIIHPVNDTTERPFTFKLLQPTISQVLCHT